MRTRLLPVSLLGASLAVIATATLSTQDANPTANETFISWEHVQSSPDNVTWISCFDHFFCTRLNVPLNWDDPSCGTIDIAMIKYPSSSNASAQE